MFPSASGAKLFSLGLVAAIVFLVALGIVWSGGGGLAAARSSRRCVVPGVGKPLGQVWRPDTPAALRYKRTRAGDIAFAIRTDSRFYAYRPDHVEWSASVLKAMLLVAYLDRPSVARRDLSGSDRALLNPMITVSDNDAATEVRSIVGNSGLSALAHRVGMTSFEPAAIWGESHITVRDQTKFFLHIDSFIPKLHRAYAMRLLASITPPQRWGIGEVAPKGWKLYYQGRLWVRYRPDRSPGRAAGPRLRARVRRRLDHGRRQPRVRQGNPEGHVREAAARAADGH